MHDDHQIAQVVDFMVLDGWLSSLDNFRNWLINAGLTAEVFGALPRTRVEARTVRSGDLESARRGDARRRGEMSREVTEQPCPHHDREPRGIAKHIADDVPQRSADGKCAVLARARPLRTRYGEERNGPRPG